jgi:hypothetical protein
MDDNRINNDFDDFLKKRYENHTIEPDGELWEGLNARLYQKKFNKSFSNVRNLKIAIVSLAIFLVATFLYFEVKTQKFQHETQSISEISKTSVSSDKSNENLLTVKQENNTRKGKIDSNNNISGLASDLSIGASSENKTKRINVTDSQTRENNKIQSAQKPVSAFIEKIEITKDLELGSLKFFKPINPILIFNIKPDIENPVNLQMAGVTKIFQVSQKPEKRGLKSPILNQSLTVSGESGTASSGKKRSPFFIEGFISPEISYRALATNVKYGIPDYGKTYFNNKEKADFTFSTGISGGFGITGNIVLRSGLFYSRYTLKFKTEAIHLLNTGFDGSLIYTSSGPVNLTLSPSDSLSNESLIKSSLNFSYINIPLIAEFHFRNNYFLDLGLSFNMLVGQNMNWQAEDYDGDFSDTFGDPLDGLEKGIVSMIVGIGTEKKISHNLSLIINPSLRISLNSINNTAPVKSYPYSWGLNAGLRYYIN